jgi:FMN phosphatase YigB (HAD superfamily)
VNRWSSTAVSSSVVEAVLTAWEMERHHAAERHLYAEVLPALKQIKKEHPGVIIGAVTDGKANPKFMTFTLAQYFDFCINWEDDQGGRRKFFQELSKVEGNAELTWIYNATYEKGRELSEAAAAIRSAKKSDDGTDTDSETESDSMESIPIVGQDNAIWIHVGDDLAYDVGGSAQCGAKTVLAELADKYGQTARHRFTSDHQTNENQEQPEWSVASLDELKARAKMNQAATEYVNERLEYWHLLPDVINKILDDESK